MSRDFRGENVLILGEKFKKLEGGGRKDIFGFDLGRGFWIGDGENDGSMWLREGVDLGYCGWWIECFCRGLFSFVFFSVLWFDVLFEVDVTCC